MRAWQPVFYEATPPVYRQDQPGRSLFYAPGWLVVVRARRVTDFHSALIANQQCGWPEAGELYRRAIRARQTWLSQQTNPFAPVCLTLYLNNACNLKCAYCFSDPSGSNQVRLSLDVVQGAAEIVARNCQAQQCPLTVVFHGGGEPTKDEKLMVQALDYFEQIADRHHLTLFRYLATNGIMPPAKAARLVDRFDLIGLSCDGPEDIQNLQRPLRWAGRRTSAWFVEQTALAVHASGRPLHVRVTVTPATFQRQAEIAEYICTQLIPQEIHIEPVYASGRAGQVGYFSSDQAETYVAAFLQGQDTARRHGIRWLASGSRPGEIHGAYCNIWRSVLNLTPEGTVTACFKASQAQAARRQGVELGAWEAATQQFKLDVQRANNLRLALCHEPKECTTCFNYYHCARQCPHACLLEPDTPVERFRCRVQAALADRVIQESADRLWGEFSTEKDMISGEIGRV
jgi:uncharacterized protein